MNPLRAFSTFLLLALLIAAPTITHGAGDLAAGKEALSAGRIDAAIGHLSKALDSGALSKEDRAEAYYQRGRAHEAKGYWADAEQDYGWALALSGHNRDYLKAFRKIRRRNAPGPL